MNLIIIDQKSKISLPLLLFTFFNLNSLLCVCERDHCSSIGLEKKKRKLIQSTWPCNKARRGPPGSFHSSRTALTLSYEQQSQRMNKIWKNNTLIYLNCTIIWQIWEVLHKHFHQNNSCLVSFQSAKDNLRMTSLKKITNQIYQFVFCCCRREKLKIPFMSTGKSTAFGTSVAALMVRSLKRARPPALQTQLHMTIKAHSRDVFIFSPQ